MTSNEHFDGLDWKQDIKYFLALTEITSACSTMIRNGEMEVLGRLVAHAALLTMILFGSVAIKHILKQQKKME